MPQFAVDFSQPSQPFDHFWEHTVGSGHAPLALRADWQAQLRQSHQELGFQHVRFHNLLSDSIGTVIVHQDELLYSFFNIDRIYDFLLSVGVRPFVELSFMPRALASGEKTVFNYAANVTPPQDYGEWAALIEKLARHWVERYGLEEVRRWYFEVWNEPNLDAFWAGDQDDYFKLYRHTVEAIKGVDASLQVGGPSTAKNAWIEEFLTFCEKNDLPADFVTTHHYPTDAFGSPDDDTETQLAKSRRSVLREQAQDACRRAAGRPLFYTEWNSSSNPRDPLHDQAYAAAFVTKTVMEMQGIVDGYSFWTFSDIFEENYFPSQPFHGGFGLLNLYGIPKPVYRAYELLHRLGTEQLFVDGIHHTVDAWAVRGDGELTVLLTNHALPQHPLRAENVSVVVAQAPEPQTVRVARIDEEHANPRRLWQELGEPRYLSDEQVGELLQASELTWEPLGWQREEEATTIELTLPPQSVAAVTLELGGERR
ncbi:MAG: glycosyl hydrolase [Anaerolineae bacterium]|nr:glycosyl hydrolase [Anaerolineae bacterium]